MSLTAPTYRHRKTHTQSTQQGTQDQGKGAELTVAAAKAKMSRSEGALPLQAIAAS